MSVFCLSVLAQCVCTLSNHLKVLFTRSIEIATLQGEVVIITLCSHSCFCSFVLFCSFNPCHPFILSLILALLLSFSLFLSLSLSLSFSFSLSLFFSLFLFPFFNLRKGSYQKLHKMILNPVMCYNSTSPTFG